MQFIHRVPARIFAIVALSLMITSGLTLFFLNQATQSAYAQRETKLKELLTNNLSYFQSLQDKVDAGELTLQEAQATAIDLIKYTRYNENGYYFVYSLEGYELMHGVKHDLAGSYAMDTQHKATGRFLSREMVELAKAQGEGKVEYPATAPGLEGEHAKMTYVKLFEPWGWVLCTGAYFIDINADIAKLRNVLIAVLIVSLGALTCMSSLLARSVTKPLSGLKNRMEGLANGDTNTPIPSTKSKSEVGDMARTLDVFRGSLIRQEELETEERAHAQERAVVVSKLSENLGKLSSGDLNAQIDTKFSEEFEPLRHDYNAAVDRMATLLSEIVSSVSSINNEAHALDKSSEELGIRTETQAASLEQTTAALQELSTSLNTSTKEADNAAAKVSQTRDQSQHGSEIVAQTIKAMQDIAESSQKISNITAMIDDISFQTNLLALNAGVEAARAGEAGRGFAVVASEVRALAAKSSDAAQDIAVLIAEASKQVEVGVSMATNSGEALSTITNNVSEIEEIVRQMASATKQQSLGISEISTAANQLDQVTQQNAAMFEESAASTQRLRDETRELEKSSHKFAIPQEASQPSAHGDESFASVA